jgi:tRNA-2-methylthio-N6-dimethylallyladenosine synthase
MLAIPTTESSPILPAPVPALQVGELIFPPRKVYIKTYGCQMNEHDTQRILSHLQELNFSAIEEYEDADLVLFNTCAIRDLSNSKFYSHLGEMKRLSAEKNIVVGVAGCIAQTEGEELLKKYRHLDFAFGTDVIDQINEMIYRVYAGEKKFFVNAFDKTNNYSIETKITHNSPQAFVNIMKGCDKFCSYCIVPFTRGREKSRLINEIIDDVKKLVTTKGVQEVTLLGQNVNSFGKKNKESFTDLCRQLDVIEGLQVLRYTSPYPLDFTDDLISFYGESKKLSRNVHMPVQSGSNEVLKRMRRGYTVEQFLELVAKLRQVRPDIVLTTDMICGFPNETEEEHHQSLDLLEKAHFDFIYSYSYSQRPGTKAALIEDTLTEPIRNRRLRELQALQLTIQGHLRKQMVGKVYRLVVNGHGEKYGIKKWKGRTNCMRIVHFRPENEETERDYQWHWVDVEITEATSLSCQGKIIYDHGKRLPPDLKTPYVVY